MHISDVKYIRLLKGFRNGALPAKGMLKKIIICDALDEDVWRTTEEGKHFKFDSDSGEIKAGFGGKHNGKKIGSDWKKSETSSSEHSTGTAQSSEAQKVINPQFTSSNNTFRVYFENDEINSPEECQDKIDAIFDSITGNESPDEVLEISGKLDELRAKQDTWNDAEALANGDPQKAKILHSGEPVAICGLLRDELKTIGNKDSKWSGKLNVYNGTDAAGAKEWSCDISLCPDPITRYDYSTYIHELLHSKSISHKDPQTYMDFSATEEGAVQLLSEEWCKKRGVSFSKAYSAQTRALRDLCKLRFPGMDNYEFARMFFDISPDERYNKVSQWVSDGLKQAKDYSTQKRLIEIDDMLMPYRKV